MKNTFTFLEIQQLEKEENDLKNLIDTSDVMQLEEPDEKAVSNILAYSKALSVRPSKNIDFIEMLIN